MLRLKSKASTVGNCFKSCFVIFSNGPKLNMKYLRAGNNGPIPIGMTLARCSENVTYSVISKDGVVDLFLTKGDVNVSSGYESNGKDAAAIGSELSISKPSSS